MKQYKPEDFKTFFAQQQARQELETINWPVLRAHFNTDIMGQIRNAVYTINATTGEIPNRLPDNHPLIRLSNGTTVTPQIANDFAYAHGQYSFLKAMAVIEETFDKTTDLQKIVREFSEAVMPPPGELNFALVLKMYPAEATHIYFQFKFGGEMRDGVTYASVTGFLNDQLRHNNIPPGPVAISAFDALALVAQGWVEMSKIVDEEIIPELAERKQTPGKNGPPVH